MSYVNNAEILKLNRQREYHSASGCPPHALYQDQRGAYSIYLVYPFNMYATQRKLDGGMESIHHRVFVSGGIRGEA